ncbi:membrane-bound lytic murein transglycosylase A [Nitrosospira sp. Nl5]|uniref:murein transglycosylase A n=1 Tax=Nitrosospira sp. Nl5 TaxID=200120 RepID=UPI000891FAD5|nr:murein transglycosylase A [Nitrosospira sp. Nl5]SCY19587.1 membrane-bound lytic murein transglycosylase A [Nitrosospira sp. Nl5]
MKNQLSFLAVASLLLLSACSTMQIGARVAPEKPAASIPPAVPSPIALLRPTDWGALTGWTDDDILPAWDAFLRSCAVLKNQPLWQETCVQADSLRGQDGAILRQFFERRFVPHQVLNSDGDENGLITGYYEPLLKGSRKRSGRYRYPLYTTPDELLVVDLSEVYPELKNMRLRGRLQGRKVVPYYSRSEIEKNPAPLQGRELLWVDDAVDLFFLQIQGSGRVQLENGEVVRVGYSEQNGHPYKSIGRLLVERGELPLEKASMQGIKAWGQRNPGKLNELLQQNSSFVFFRELPAGLPGPLGALGVPLTAGRSLAVDPRAIPQGAPVFLATTWPNTDKQLHRLMVAQDTGGAIKGGVRADFFWGFGQEAGDQAGKMKQSGKMWVLMPNGYVNGYVAPTPVPQKTCC